MPTRDNLTNLEALARLLAEAANAHDLYERQELGGVRDEDWAAWYARYLLERGVEDMQGWPAWAHSEEGVAGLLAAADESHRANAPHEEWPPYYARHILSRE